MTIESITVGSICLAVWACFYDVWSGAVNGRSKSASQPRYNKRVVIHTCTYMYMVHVVLHVSEFHYDTIKDAVLCAMCQRWRAADRFSKWRNQYDAQVCCETESSADSSRAWMYRLVCKSSKPSHVPMTPSPKYASPGYVSNPIYGSSI